MKKMTFILIRTLLLSGGYFLSLTTVSAQIDFAYTDHHLNVDFTHDSISQYNHIMLSWKTLLEAQYKGFEVEHSRYGKQWHVMGFVDAANHNHSHTNHKEHHHYHFITKQLESGHHLFRLKTIDLDGQHFFNHAITLELHMDETHRLVSILPNPLHHENVELTLALKDTQEVTLHLTDKNGHVMKTLFTGKLTNHTIHGFSFSLQDIVEEFYTIVIEGESFHHHHTLTHTTH